MIEVKVFLKSGSVFTFLADDIELSKKDGFAWTKTSPDKTNLFYVILEDVSAITTREINGENSQTS